MAATGDGSYEISGPGEQAEVASRAEFEQLLRNDALTLMRKRGSTTLDETDFKRAYGRLLESDNSARFREGIAEAGVFVGGGILAYGTTLALQDSPRDRDGNAQPSPVHTPGVWLAVIGCLLAGLAIAFRHWSR